MIIRAWRGWASADAAPSYEKLLNETIAPEIMRRGIVGLRELAVLRRSESEADGSSEFLTLMTFDDWTAVAEFAGPDPSVSIVPPAARALLTHFDARSEHYDLLARHMPDPE